MIVKSPKNKPDTNKVHPKNGSPANFGIAGQPGKSANNGAKKKKKAFIQIPPWKIILTTVLVGIAGYLYLSHLFATQSLYQEVQQLEQEYEASQRIYQDRQLTYDRMTGPVQIYNHAEDMGFIHGQGTDRVIETE